MLAVVFMTSAADRGTLYNEDRGGREYRVRSSFSYALVGLVLIGVGVAVETF